MASVVYLNGEFLPRERATIPVDDRGFLFGDGVYEVTRASDGRLFAADRHIRRLERSVRELSIGFDVRADELLDLHHQLLDRNGLREGQATVYLQVTRGVAPRTHAFPSPPVPPTVFASAAPLRTPEDLRARGAAIATLPDIRWARCDIKSINLLGNVLAKQHAADRGAFEGVFVRDGIVTEGAHTNVFAVLGGAIVTHPCTPRILGGVTRDVVLEIARELGHEVVEEPFALADLERASEAFVTSTTSDVMPVVDVDGRAIGGGTPGPVARALHEALVARMRAADVAEVR